jgi:hypothetical protein
MWITDLNKAINILLERGYQDLVINKVSAGGGDILAVFYTTYHSKLVVYKNGLILGYGEEEEEE